MREPSGGPRGTASEALALVTPGRPILDYLPGIALALSGLALLAFVLMVGAYSIW